MSGITKSIAKATFGLLFCLVSLNATEAASLEPARGDVVLTVSGAIAHTNAGEIAEFDTAMLDAIGTVTFETETTWTEGVQTFTGVELSDLLSVLGVNGSQLRATAVNDYAVDIPTGDAVEGGPIVAFLRNGELMSLRDKGPLWIVYPYDSSPKYRTEVIFSRSIWQLDRIEVLP